MYTYGDRDLLLYPHLILLQNKCYFFIITNKRCLTAVPVKTLAVSCHILDLCQKVRHIAVHGHNFDGYGGLFKLTFP